MDLRWPSAGRPPFRQTTTTNLRRTVALGDHPGRTMAARFPVRSVPNVPAGSLTTVPAVESAPWTTTRVPWQRRQQQPRPLPAPPTGWWTRTCPWAAAPAVPSSGWDPRRGTLWTICTCRITSSP
uniref:(northern house mosquito) hypothetical protein n=1 Tax=Culex pipiens TaxID=7175 RepID=A0A8D8HFL4_CULPI